MRSLLRSVGAPTRPPFTLCASPLQPHCLYSPPDRPDRPAFTGRPDRPARPCPQCFYLDSSDDAYQICRAASSSFRPLETAASSGSDLVLIDSSREDGDARRAALDSATDPASGRHRRRSSVL